MATDFIMPRPDQQAHHPAFLNQNAVQSIPRTPFQSSNYSQISPLSTSNSNNNTAANASPQSPKGHYGRQVRPLYMPAVLRPNEHPSKPHRADSTGATDSTGTSPVRPNSSYLTLAGFGALNRLRRRSTDESKKCSIVAEDNSIGWNLDVFPVVTDLPTRKHWKPDPDSTICDEPTCKRYFNYFTRRHHCRRCGNIFCDLHSPHEIPLDQNAEYNPRAPVPSRSCSHCYSEYSAWRSRTNSQASSTASSEANLHMLAHHGINQYHHGNHGVVASAGARVAGVASAGVHGHGHQRSQSHHQIISSTGSSPILASPAAINVANPLGNLTHVGSPDAAASVPRDWNWSTF
ncbi:hypothetical protein MKZ38_007902 [Zalerion maritima]|uniref:FYVE-type domain-containing protein n=1 Tax=Zalerion maritima TaxID=339359 RepID=A0AAD5RI28_9PEZI|nr:hypothetical protein MKZ38_007902 [Zalerion maritima]